VRDVQTVQQALVQHQPGRRRQRQHDLPSVPGRRDWGVRREALGDPQERLAPLGDELAEAQAFGRAEQAHRCGVHGCEPLLERAVVRPQDTVPVLELVGEGGTEGQVFSVILPIPGTSSVAHVEQNVAAAHVELSDEDVSVLDMIA
jgi:hypothetical protein